MMKDTEEILNEWGRKTVFVSRDYTISLIMNEIINDGKLPKNVENIINTLNNEQMFALKYLIVNSIDTTVHNTLWSIESYKEHKLMLEDNNGELINVDDELNEIVGAGITGAAIEFIDEYSKYNTADEFLATGKLEKE